MNTKKQPTEHAIDLLQRALAKDAPIEDVHAYIASLDPEKARENFRSIIKDEIAYIDVPEYIDETDPPSAK